MTMNPGSTVLIDHESISRYADLFDALSDPTRLAILQHLASGPHRVRDLVEHLNLAQSTVSAHLACLRECGLVESRAEGRSSWFTLVSPKLLDAILGSAEDLLTSTGNRAAPRLHPTHPHKEKKG